MSKKNYRLARRKTFDAELEHPSLHLMAVEEPDVVTLPGRLADHRSNHQEEQKELYLPCCHVLHLLSLEPEVL